MSDTNPASGSTIEPNEWQDRIVLYLRIRYQLDLVTIPDVTRGDAGLEAFARDGSCYQCYAPQNDPTPKERYQHCRDKITEDIGKFCKNDLILKKLFANTPIRRWVFVTPKHTNKELVIHAEKKTEEVRNKNLPYATRDFAISIVTESYFEVEKKFLIDSALRKLHITPDDIPNSEIQAYVESNSSQIIKLDRKLAKLRQGEKARGKLRALMLQRYLRGENVLAQMREYGEFFERIMQCRAFRQDILEEESLRSTSDPNATLDRTIEQFIAELGEAVKAIDPQTIELLARASVVGWLLECPLDFPDDEDDPR